MRFSGQDVGRGTFSHRHAMLVDQLTDEMHVPLNSISEQQNAFLEVNDVVMRSFSKLTSNSTVNFLPTRRKRPRLHRKKIHADDVTVQRSV